MDIIQYDNPEKDRISLYIEDNYLKYTIKDTNEIMEQTIKIKLDSLVWNKNKFNRITFGWYHNTKIFIYLNEKEYISEKVVNLNMSNKILSIGSAEGFYDNLRVFEPFMKGEIVMLQHNSSIGTFVNRTKVIIYNSGYNDEVTTDIYVKPNGRILWYLVHLNISNNTWYDFSSLFKSNSVDFKVVLNSNEIDSPIFNSLEFDERLINQ